MSDEIAKIEVYPDYNFEGSMDLDLPFSYSCMGLDLMGYTRVAELIKDIKSKLKKIELEDWKMTYWKIESLEKLIKIEKENELNENSTITKGYINHLETELRLMKEAYEQGFKDGQKEIAKK